MSIQDSNFLSNSQAAYNNEVAPEDYINKEIQNNPSLQDRVNLLRKKGMDNNTIALGIMYHNSKGSLTQNVKGGFVRGYESTFQGVDALSKLLSNATGISIVKNPEQRIAADQNIINANTSSAPSLFKSKNLSDVGANVAQTVGGLGEFLGEILAGGGVGGAIGKGIAETGLKIAAKPLIEEAISAAGEDASKKFIADTVLKQSLKKETSKKIIEQAVKKGNLIGAFSTIAPSQIGNEYAAGGYKHPLKAIAGGLATSALYTLSPASVLGKVDIGSKAIDESIQNVIKDNGILSKYPAASSRAINAIKSGIEQGTILGGAATTTELGSNQSVNLPDIGKNALLGALLGGITGGLAKPKLPVKESISPVTEQTSPPSNPGNILTTKEAIALMPKDEFKLTGLDRLKAISGIKRKELTGLTVKNALKQLAAFKVPSLEMDKKVYNELKPSLRDKLIALPKETSLKDKLISISTPIKKTRINSTNQYLSTKQKIDYAKEFNEKDFSKKLLAAYTDNSKLIGLKGIGDYLPLKEIYKSIKTPGYTQPHFINDLALLRNGEMKIGNKNIELGPLRDVGRTYRIVDPITQKVNNLGSLSINKSSGVTPERINQNAFINYLKKGAKENNTSVDKFMESPQYKKRSSSFTTMDKFSVSKAKEAIDNTKMTLFHASSKPNLRTLEPGKMGSNKAGAELNRSISPEPQLAFWMKGADRLEPHLFGNSHFYTIKVPKDKMYPLDQDKELFNLYRTHNMQGTSWEKALKSKGYIGWYSDKVKQARLFKSSEATYLGKLNFSNSKSNLIGYYNSRQGIKNEINFTSEQRIKTYADMASYTKKNDGATFNPRTLKNESTIPEGKPDAYAVGVFPTISKVIKSAPTAKIINEFELDNADIFNKPNTHIGLWYDKKDESFYMDATVLVRDKNKAIELGKKYGQKAIFDIKNQEEINTGGTGKPPSNLPSINDTLNEIKNLDNPPISKLSYSDNNEANKISNDALNLFDKSFNERANSIAKNMLGDRNVTVKSVNNITLEDIGGKKAAIDALSAHNINASDWSDSKILNSLKNVKGVTKIDPLTKSTLIMIAHHPNDVIGQSLYHELWHASEVYNIIKPDDLNILKNYLKKEYPNDTRDWSEVAADDFSWYALTHQVPKDEPIIATLYRKMKNFINNLRLKFGGKKNPEDIYNSLLSNDKSNLDLEAYKNYNSLNPIVKFNYTPSEASNNTAYDKAVADNADLNPGSFLDRARIRITQAKNFAAEFWNNSIHGLSPELANKKLTPLTEIVRHIASHIQIALHNATEDIQDIQRGLTPSDRFMMTRYLVIKDIARNLTEGTQDIEAIKSQWKGVFKDSNSVFATEKYFEKAAKDNPRVTEALKRRRATYSQLFSYLHEKGIIDAKNLSPEAYFHRITWDYFRAKIKINNHYMFSSPKIDPLTSRINSSKSYITNYMQSEMEALSQFHLLKLYSRSIDAISKFHSKDMEQLQREFIILKHKKPTTVKELQEFIKGKDKYKDFTVTSRTAIPHYHSIYTVAEDTADEITQAIASPSNTPDKLMLVRKELIPALRRVTEFNIPTPIETMLQTSISIFKKMVLFFPTRVLKYSLNNLTGDLDISTALSPKIAMVYGKKSFQDLYNYYYKDGVGLDDATKAELKDGSDRLVLGTNITQQEVLKDINSQSLDAYKNVLGSKSNFIFKPFNGYWNVVTKANDFRENILRLAAWRYYKNELITLGKKPDEVYSVVDKESARYLDKQTLAAKMAREGIGDYGNISPNGQWIRKNLIPFWSWTEINMPRYVKLFKRLVQEGTIKGHYLSGTTFAVRGIIKMTFMYAAINAWNSTFFPKESDAINEANKGQLHLILGRGTNGDVRTMRFQGALSDALDWFGLGNAKTSYKEIADGQINYLDFMKKMPYNVINRFINSSVPIQKAIVEDLAGESLYPNVSSPKPIRDKAQHLFKLFGLGMPYRLLFSNTPLRESDRSFMGKLEDIASGSLTYTTDINSTNYYISRNLVSKFMQDNGITPPKVYPSPKSNYAFEYKKALQYGDKDAAILFLAKYYSMGGTLQSMFKSFNSSDVLTNLPINLRRPFLASLLPADKERVENSIKWHRMIYNRHSNFSNSTMGAIYRSAWKLSKNKNRSKK